MPGNILWAIDTSAGLELNLQCLSALRTLVNSGLGPIQPVSVIRPQKSGTPSAQLHFETFVAKIELPGLLSPKVISCKSSTARAVARAAYCPVWVQHEG